METPVPSANKTYRKIGPYPVRTLVAIIFLSALVATVLWFRYVYKSPVSKPTSTPTVLLDRPKLSPPSLPQDAISPLKIQNISLTLSEDPTLPGTSYVLTATPSSSFEDFAQKLAVKLNLRLVTATADKITWSNQSSTLLAFKKDKYLSYFLNQLPDKTKPAPDLQSAPGTIQVYLANLGLWQAGYSINSQEVKSLSTSGYDLVPSGTQAPDVLEIPFHYLVNQTPLVLGQQEHPLVVRLGHNQQVIGFTLYPFQAALQNLTDYTLISFDKIKDQLSQNSEKLISVEPLGYGASPASSTITSATITSIENAYYFSPTNNLLYPSYLLKGQGSFSDGSQASLTFLLPAPDPSYFQ